MLRYTEMRGMGGTWYYRIVDISGICGTFRWRLVVDALVVMGARLVSTMWGIGGLPALLTTKQRNQKKNQIVN